MKRLSDSKDTKLILLIISIITDSKNMLFNDLISVLPNETSQLLKTNVLSEKRLKKEIMMEREKLQEQMKYLIQEIMKNPEHPLYEKMLAIFTD